MSKICLIDNGERVLAKAFAYIINNNLYSEFLQKQGIKVSDEDAKRAYYDFIESHVGDQYAYLYVSFAKQHQKGAKSNGENRK